jgi:xanthine dehydrogenase accessory factor
VSPDETAARVDVARAVEAALAALRGGDAVVCAVVFEAAEPALLGRRLLVWDERGEGSLGDTALDARAYALAREVLRERRPATREIDGVTLYLEPHFSPPELVIVGAGHIARPLCRIGAMLGFTVRVLDDRPEFATRERFPEAEEVRRADFGDPFRGLVLSARTHLVLVTRGHKYDFDALSDVLRRPDEVAYIGMVGSRRRTRAALEMLEREGIPAERLRKVYAPIGLDIGAETPDEIAVAIAAELIRLRRGGTGQSLRDRERVVERWVGKEL